MTNDALPQDADIIVVGGGTAGCIVADRTAAAFPDLQVVIIDEGDVALDDPQIKRLPYMVRRDQQQLTSPQGRSNLWRSP